MDVCQIAGRGDLRLKKEPTCDPIPDTDCVCVKPADMKTQCVLKKLHSFQRPRDVEMIVEVCLWGGEHELLVSPTAYFFFISGEKCKDILCLCSFSPILLLQELIPTLNTHSSTAG